MPSVSGLGQLSRRCPRRVEKRRAAPEDGAALFPVSRDSPIGGGQDGKTDEGEGTHRAAAIEE